MVLASGFGQHYLHRLSKRALKEQKTRESACTSSQGTSNIRMPTFGTAPTPKENPKIPDPNIFEFASENSGNDNTALPTVAECAAHLELLQAFCHVRDKVLSSSALDAALGIKPEPRIVYRRDYIGYRRGYRQKKVKLRDNTFQERRKAKWPFYLALAAVRFRCWADAVEKELDGPTASKLNLLHLPPIDILMVWHALLLNPSWFRSLNARALKSLFATPFPWNEIHNAIDADKSYWPYNLQVESTTWFVEKTGLEPDLFEALVKTNKSNKIQLLLERQGAPACHANTLRSLTVEDVDAVLKRPANLDKVEVMFLMCCRTAVDNDTTITKLVEAVQRQDSFIDKMEKQLWIRSPAVKGTLCRAIDRYGKFLKLFKLYPHMMFVPTLDIDLVWHTHQCSPSRYEAGTVKIAGRLIDHDEEFGETTLNIGFTRTRDFYRIRFGQDYQICNCWDCEALLSAITAPSSEARMYNWIIARHVYENVAYHRAVEIARQNGHSRLPIRIQKP